MVTLVSRVFAIVLLPKLCFAPLVPPQLTSGALWMKLEEFNPIRKIRVYGASRLGCILEIAIVYYSTRLPTKHRLYYIEKLCP